MVFLGESGKQNMEDFLLTIPLNSSLILNVWDNIIAVQRGLSQKRLLPHLPNYPTNSFSGSREPTKILQNALVTLVFTATCMNTESS